MATKPYFRFRLRNPDTGEDYYIFTPTNVVASAFGESYLVYAPAGWAEIELKYARNLKYYGLFREFSTQLKFVRSGARILRHLFYQAGSEARCSLRVDELNPETLDYDFLIETELDFSTAQDEKVYFGINILEGGVTAQMKANEDVEYAIPITGADIVPITIPSLKLTGNVKYLSGWPVPDTAASGGGNLEGVTSYFRPTMTFVSKKVSPLNTTTWIEPIMENTPTFIDTPNVTGQYFQINPNAGVYPLSQNYLFYANTELTNVFFKSQQFFFVANNSGTNGTFRASLYLINILNTSVAYESYLNGLGTPLYSVNSGNINTGGSATFSLTIEPSSFTIPYGYALVIQYGLYNGATILSDYNVAWENARPVEIQFQYYAASFNVKGIRASRLAQLLVSEMTGGDGILNSPILTSDNYIYGSKAKNRIYLSEDSIRGVNSSGYTSPVIKTSWKDFFQDMNGGYDVGMSIDDNVVKVLYKGDIFTNDVIADIGEPKSVNIDAATDFNYKTLSIGYEDREHDVILSDQEVNTTHLYNFPKRQGKGELNHVSPYRADIWGIFEAYINNTVNKEKKEKANTDVYVVEIANWDGSGQAVPYQPTGTIIGISDASTLFNAMYSPKHNFWRHAAFYSSILYGLEDSTIRFQKGDRNVSMQTSFGYGYTIENGDVPVIWLGNRYFKPFIFSIETSLPRNIINTVKDAGGVGVIRFTYRNRTLTGYVMEIAQTPSRPKKHTIRLLSTDTNDLTFLEYGK